MDLPKHILVVEDEPDTAELLELHLQNEGYRVTVAADGEQALSKLHKLMPDMVILDLMIPEIDGLQVYTKRSCHRVIAGDDVYRQDQ